MPFETPVERNEHFIRHGHEFGVILTESEYENRADAFMFGPQPWHVLECVRPQGGFARYSQVAQEYGTVNSRGFLSTYFIPDPARHGKASNLEYYRQKCR